MIGWSPRQIKKTRSSPSTATPATSRCSNPFGSCSQPSTTSYLMVGLLRDSTPGALHAPARSYTVAALREASMCLDPSSRRRLLRAMRMLTTWLAVVALLLGVGALAPVAAQPAGTLVVGLVAEPVNLDPAQVTDLNSNRVGRRIVETLVTFPDESTQIVAGLAESWTISKGAQVRVQAPQGHHVSRRGAVRRRRREVLHRTADRDRASLQQARQVSVRELLLRQRQGRRGRRPAHGGVQPQGAACVVSGRLDGGGRLDRQSDRGEEARNGLSAEPGRHRPLQVRVVGPRPARGAREKRELLEAPGESGSRDLPTDRRGPGAAHRAAHGGPRPHRRHAA